MTVLTSLIAGALAFAQKSTYGEGYVPSPSTAATLTIKASPERDFSRKPRSPWDTFFSITVKNVSDGPIRLRKAGFWPNHLVILRDAKGNELPLTRLGIEMRQGATCYYLTRDHDDPKILQPGETYDYGLDFQMRRLYDPKPGTYFLTVEYFEHYEGLRRVVSNILEIVVPPKTEE